MNRTRWLEPSDLRIGLGCMRLSTDDTRDEEAALETIAAAVDAGVTVFDTARAYGHGATELGHNERLLSRALRRGGVHTRARVVTKGGMTRTDGGWIPDGRARSILSDCESSLAALDGLAIDLYLIHAPDPRTPWQTTVRALARLYDEGMVRRVGIANVNRPQFEAALELADISAVQVALSLHDDSAVRGGMVERCAARGIVVMAHSPLGGPRRANRLARNQALIGVAEANSATATEVALAWLLALSPNIVAIPGARRPETARSAARAARLQLSPNDLAALARAFGRPRAARVERSRHHTSDAAEVVLVMGVPGAGKSRVAQEYAARGYARLNRDELGGSLRELAGALDVQLASGVRRIVLDNTYLTRAARSDVIEVVSRNGGHARCVWIDTPLAQAQVNLVERLLERFSALPTPDELRALARHEQGVLAPTSQMRAFRELEPPSMDEGFSAVERVPFTRASIPARSRRGVFITAAALRHREWKRALDSGDRSAPHLVYDWSPDGTPDELDACVSQLSATLSAPIERGLCSHPAGPPTCWCRPPLPGLPLAFARAHGVDPSRSILIGDGAAHRTLAVTLGARYVQV